MNLVRTVASPLRAMTRAAANRYFDLRNGVDTYRSAQLSTLSINSEHKSRGVQYEPTPAHVLRQLMTQLKLSTDQTFVDFGCGKGRALMVAAEFGFQHVVGVEFAAELCAVAQRNLAGLWERKRLKSTFSVIHDDAANFGVSPDCGVFFLYNPFDGEVMRRVMSNLLASWRANPRTIRILYYNPVWREVLDENPELLSPEAHVIDGCRFLVYQTRPEPMSGISDVTERIA